MRGSSLGGVFLALGLLYALLTAAEAQQAKKVFRVGVLSIINLRSAPQFVAFAQRLQELGYVEGQNVAFEFRNAEGQAERLADLAAELVRLQVDVIVVPGPEAQLRAARQATRTIPIIMLATNYDPIARGYIDGLARPGGNITGVFSLQLELTAKRLELLKEALPQLTRVSALWDAYTADQWRATEAAAQSLGLQAAVGGAAPSPLRFRRRHGHRGPGTRSSAGGLVLAALPAAASADRRVGSQESSAGDLPLSGVRRGGRADGLRREPA